MVRYLAYKREGVRHTVDYTPPTGPSFFAQHTFFSSFSHGGGRGKRASTNSYFLKKIWVIPIVFILFSSITLLITIFITMLRQIHSVTIFDGIKKKKLWIYCRWRYKIVISKVVLLKKIETIVNIQIFFKK
jgi:hypothetical protein